MSRRIQTDHAHDAKRREQVYQHWYAEILREARDQSSLLRIESRAMGDPDVARDPELSQMIRGCCMQLQQDFARKTRDSTRAEAQFLAPTLSRSAAARTERALWTRDQVCQIFQRLDHDFHDHVTRLDEARARSALAKMETLLADYAECIDGDHLVHCNRELSRIAAKRSALDHHIAKLQDRAIQAARAGDNAGTARALQRLSTIHAARPHVLPDERFRRIREEMMRAAETREHRHAAAELVRRERAVAEELRKLADIIHQFHITARRVPHHSPEYRTAEQEYQRAVLAVRSHDNDWLASLILGLMDLLEEWHDPTNQGQTQVDRFLDSVRVALRRLHREIREIEQETHKTEPPP